MQKSLWYLTFFIFQKMSQVKGLNLIQKLSSFQRIQFLHTQPKKRFYKNVSVVQANGQFEINLDHRKLKTPMGSPLLVRQINLYILKCINFVTDSKWNFSQCCGKWMDVSEERNKPSSNAHQWYIFYFVNSHEFLNFRFV